jgi:hypothetical protein
MIISATTKTEEAAQALYELEKFFQENNTAKKLSSKHHLELGMELLEDYVLIVIKPIRTVSLKNELKILLQTKYPDAFTVQNIYKKKIRVSLPEVEKKSDKVTLETVTPKNKKSIKKIVKNTIDTKEVIKTDTLINSIANEWLALLVLAFAGLLLVYRSTLQINKIKKLQHKLEAYQEKVGDQMDYIGEQYE